MPLQPDLMPPKIKNKRGVCYQLRLSPLPLAPPNGQAQHPSIKKSKRDARKLRKRVRSDIARAERRVVLLRTQQELFATLAAENNKLTGGAGVHENHQ